MKANISLPGVKMQTLEKIAEMNEIIDKYENDKEPLTKDSIDKIRHLSDGNVLKLLEVISTVFKNVVRNKRKDLYEDISELTQLAVDKATGDKRLCGEALYTLKDMVVYMDRQSLIRDGDYLSATIQNKITYMRGELTKLRANDGDSLNIGEESNSVNINSIHFAAVVDSLLEMCQELSDELVLQESIKDKARRAGEKVTNSLVRFSLRERELSDKLNDKFNRFLKEYKEKRKTNSYDKIVQDTMNLSKMLKSLFASSIVALLVPGGLPIKLISAVITILISFAVSKRTDERYRQTILNDLKFELRMVQEKVRDAEAKGDRTNKYKLMRIENKLQRAIDRIKFRLPN